MVGSDSIHCLHNQQSNPPPSTAIMTGKAQVVVLDFDGTITDAEAEGLPFVQGYKKDLMVLSGLSKADAKKAIAMAERYNKAHQDSGWEYNGLIVAPSKVDPYLRMKALARQLFLQLDMLKAQKDRNNVLELLYVNNYRRTTNAFKPNAATFFAKLLNMPNVVVYVVTNSGTEKVQGKLKSLGVKINPSHVIGEAKKYRVGKEPTSIPRVTNLPGLNRPVQLRRTKYFMILDTIRRQNRASWKDFLVIGDIWELDLALPYALGARVGLVVNEFTPNYERKFATAHSDRIQLINKLPEVIPMISQTR